LTAALIVIEIAASTVSDDALSVLVAACTRAARDAECVLAKDVSDPQPTAVAIVSLQADDKVRVEVGLRQADRDSWRTKEFSFLAADDSLDRWRVVGFAIGTLAERNSPAREETPPPQNPPAPAVALDTRRLVRPSPKPRREPRTQVFMGATLLFGPGLDRGPLRLGSALYAGLAPPRLPVVFKVGASAATRVQSDASGARARWFEVSVGAGVPLLGSVQGSALELGGAVFAERFDVSASSMGLSEANGRWALGLQGALGGRLQVVPDLVLTADVLAAGLSEATEVHVANAPIGSASYFRYLGSLGLRVQLR
jgi:hypothetical protein